MLNFPRAAAVAVFACWLCASAIAQITARLSTSDTEITLAAEESAPKLESFAASGEIPWKNRSSEALIDSAEIAGKSVPLRWRLNRSASRIEDAQAVFVYESVSPHLRLTWEWRVRETYGPIEHQIRIENLDSTEIWIPMQDTLAFDWCIRPAESLEQMFIEKGADSPSDIGTHDSVLQDGYRWTGTSSTYGDLFHNEPREIIPWVLVQREDANQSGWYAGIEFSGRTRIALSRERDSLKSVLGLNPEPGPARTRIMPGETFESPVVFVGGFRGGPDGAGNILRPWVRAVLGNPDTWRNPSYPLVVNNSWGGGMDVNEEIAMRMIHEAADLGMDMFHLDAGWFRDVGDWYPNPKKFPHGLTIIADEAHKQGLKFGLWVDWAQAGLSTKPGALNARDPKVRDWMVTDIPSDWKPEAFKGQTIDLGVPEAKQRAQKEVERIVSDYRLDVLEHDGYLVAHGCDRTDHPHAAPDPLNECTYKSSGFYFVDSSNSTDVSYHAVRAYYDIQSRLRKDHPGILLEICNDGGRMVDFGTAAYGDYFSITDTYDPLSNRRAFYDASHVLPAAMLESYVEKWPTPTIENFRYMLRSGMMGWLSIMIDTTGWSPAQRADAKEEIAFYKKELRPLIRDADLYHISSRPDGVHWDAIEYWDPKRKSGVVYAFRGSGTETSQQFRLRGLNPAARYALTFHDHSAPDRSASGQELTSEGIKIRLAQPNSSELVSVEEKSAQ